MSLERLVDSPIADVELEHSAWTPRSTLASRYSLDTRLAISAGLILYGPVEMYVGGLQQFFLNRGGMSALSALGISRANQVFREGWMRRFGLGEDVTPVRRTWHETASAITFFAPVYETVMYLSGDTPEHIRSKMVIGIATSIITAPLYNWVRDWFFVKNGQPGVLQRPELGPPSPGAEFLLLPVGEALGTAGATIAERTKGIYRRAADDARSLARQAASYF